MFTYHPTVSRVAGNRGAFRPAVMLRNSAGQMCGCKIAGRVFTGSEAKEEARNEAREACHIAAAELRLSLPGFLVRVS